MQSGLWSRSGPVSLVDVSIKGRIVDFTGEVVVRQKYCNKEQNSVDAIFKFPLELFGALSGFEIVVGGKHIVAEVKNRAETNFQLSVRDDDVDDEEDDASFLSTEDQPDVFLCNIGVLEPGQEVEFIVTYTTVLALVGDSLRFVIPSSTFSLKDEYEHSENETSPRKKLEISSEHNLLISLDIEMPSEIQKIESPTHSGITLAEQSGNKATVSFKKGSVKKEGNFVLLIKFQKPHAPYCFVQYDPKTETKAVMLSFFPEFSLKALPSCEIIFLVDCSSSMAGSQLESVKSALQLLLRSLPAKAYFNIVLFGSTFQKVFPNSVPYDNQSLETASKYVDEMDADLGGTEIYEPLAEVLSSPMINNLPRQLFVITDGQVSNSKKIFNLISKHSHNTRVFTFGIGDRVSHHLVNGMARAGCGEAEFVTGSESLDVKIMRQLKRALQPALTNVHLDWGSFQNVTQAPRKLRTIFNGDRLLVYAFLPKDASGEGIVALKATASEGPVSFQVTLNANNFKTGNLIPVLAARARIRDLEENDDEDEEFIRNEVVKLGTTYGLASSYTSFVAHIPVPEKKASTDSIKRGFNLHSSMEMPIPSEKSNTDSQTVVVKPKPVLSVQVPVDVPDRSASVSPAPSSPAPGLGKKVYTPDFLLRFRDLCTEMPPGLVPMDVILGGGRGKNDSGKSPKGKGSGRGGKGHKRQQSSGGGRNNQKNPKTPQSPAPNPLLDKPLVHSENRWTRPTVEQLSELEQKSRKIQGILNKLTVEKFVSLSSSLLEVGITNPMLVEELIKLVYTKAVAEPHFATLYAVLCKRLSEECPSFQDADGKPINFRRLLLNRCQTEFEKKTLPALDEKMDPLEKEEVEFKFKRKVLGNIKFIGELFKEGMLPERVMHECIKVLLKDSEEASEDDIESLCKLITTIGKDLESPACKLRDQVAIYFEKMDALSKSQKLPSRFRFMLKDVIELRANNWVPRIKKNEAKTLAAARAEIMEQEEEPAPVASKALRRSESKETVRSQDAREQLPPSPGGRGRGQLPRSASESAIGESWEVVGGRGKAKGKQGWEPKSPGKPSGRGRGYSPVAERYTKKPTEEKPKETYKPKGNIFSALGNEEQSNAPKSALKASGKSVSKAVTIQEPEPVKGELSAEEISNKIEMLLEEYLASADLSEAGACVEEVNSALPEIVQKGVQLAFDKKERDRQELLKLFEYLFTEGTLKSQDFETGLISVLSTIEEVDIDNPSASKFVGTFIGHFLGGAIEPAFLERELIHLVDSGKASQITALALQTILKNKGESTLLELCQGKINLLHLLPKDSRDKDSVSKFLLKHGLECLEGSIDGSDANDETKPSSNNNNGATRTRSGSVSLTLETVIKKQCADGHWNLNSDLEAFRIGSVDAIKAAIPSYINNNEAAWATSLALQLLELRFDSSTDKWELLAEKGMDWLGDQVPDHIDQLQKDAEEFLKGRGL